MTDEQINEVMRLSDEVSGAVGELACSTNDYLSTIGEPENVFPLNPNGSSKWAHLQKHDGAQAIGVVFRTGTGSVGSLVDGRVVWADWLAHPNGSKPESVNAELLEALKSAKNWLEWYQDAYLESVSECDSEAMQKIDAAIARAESAIETPASAEASIGDALNDPRLQEAFGAAIEGAMGFGYQGINPPPTGHWLNRFWDIGAAERRKVDGFPQPAGFRDIVIDYVKGVYAFLESTSPAGFADEAFRLPPFATRAQQLFADAIQGDELGKCMGSEGKDSKNRERHEGAVAKVSPCAGHAVQQDADDLVGLRGCNSRHGGIRSGYPCTYRMRTTDPGCTGCVERDEDQPAEAGHEND